MGSQAHINGCVGFPLSPALSPGERENRPPVLELSEALAVSFALVPEPPKRGDEAKRVTISQKRTGRLPLPGGEGRGEGEWGTQTFTATFRPWLIAFFLLQLLLFANPVT